MCMAHYDSENVDVGSAVLVGSQLLYNTYGAFDVEHTDDMNFLDRVPSGCRDPQDA